MQSEISDIRAHADTDIALVTTEPALEEFRIKYLARKGAIADLFDRLKTAEVSQKPLLGKSLNELRTYVQGLYDHKRELRTAAPTARVGIDLTLPGRSRFQGSIHKRTLSRFC